MINIDSIPSYELIRQEELPDVRSTGYLLRHKKSGARVFLLENEDDNKVFNIAFRTTPVNSTGVAHIMEHSVLCGSLNYPAKDPFVELAKGSMNTFLNAMTYPDKTMYPVASCNDVDFVNLMHVYLDAVFFPNIYRHEEIFRQEGWAFHLEKEEDEITINGVVYNEMKGAFSTPDTVVERELLNALFPDNTYHYESGGDPDFIPQLTYEEFLDFHRKFYHPSNSYLYLYGRMDFEKQLQWIDEEYLGQFEQIEVDSQIDLQKPFSQMKTVELEYSVSAEDEANDQTYLAYGTVIGTSLDSRLANAMAVLEYALLEAPGAPLKEALLNAGIGNDIQSSYDSSTFQPVFSIIAKGAKEKDRDRFLQVIRETLTKVAEEGIDPGAVRAAINLMEFRFREADFGSYPKGLIYGIDVYDSWLYQDEDPFSYLKALDDYAFLKEQSGQGYFEMLIRTQLLENTHTALVMLLPKPGLSMIKEAKLAKKLREKKESMTPDEISEMIRRTEELACYQETPSTKEELEAIPLLSREDMKKKSEPFDNRLVCAKNGYPVLRHSYDTNGIAYINVLLDASCISPEDLPYLGMLRGILGFVDTAHFSYRELSNEINGRTGGITAGLSSYPDICDPGKVRFGFGMQIRTLYEELPFCFDMVSEILLTSDLKQEKRIRDLVNKMKSRTGTALLSAGSASAAARCMSHGSGHYWLNENTSGIAAYRALEKYAAAFDENAGQLSRKLTDVLAKLLSGRMLISYTGEEARSEQVSILSAKLVQAVREKAGGVCPEREWFRAGSEEGYKALKAEDFIPYYPVPELSSGREGFQTPGNVQFVARGGNFRDAGFAYHASMRVLRTILSFDYLWTNVRVMGGAYGCGGNFSRNGDSVFTSYRDPHLERTNEVYEGIPAFLEHFSADERDMTKYVIGTMSDMDLPLTPSQKGSLALSEWMSGLTLAQRQKERDEVLHVTPEDIRALAAPVRAVLTENRLCVIGSEEKVKEARKCFDSVETLQ